MKTAQEITAQIEHYLSMRLSASSDRSKGIESIIKLATNERDTEVARLTKERDDASQVSPSEREGILSHISSMLSDAEQEEFGLTGRQLHMQVLRVLSAYRDSAQERDTLAATVVEGLKWLFSERERLAVTVAELQRDRERLNWLLEFITQHGGNGIADIPWTVVDPEEIMEDRIEVVFDRAAIDSTRAAMQAKGSQ